MPAIATELLTAQEYGLLPNTGEPTELVQGRIVPMNRPHSNHGYHCVEIASILRNFVKANGLGRVVGNDSGVVTERNPDTVRGPDVAFYSFQRMPAGTMPEGYWPASPDLVIEVRSPSDRWRHILRKVGEYLNAGVSIVAVADPDRRTVHLFHAEQPSEVLTANMQLTFPDVLPGFEITVGELFE